MHLLTAVVEVMTVEIVRLAVLLTPSEEDWEMHCLVKGRIHRTDLDQSDAVPVKWHIHMVMGR